MVSDCIVLSIAIGAMLATVLVVVLLVYREGNKMIRDYLASCKRMKIRYYNRSMAYEINKHRRASLP